METTVDTIRNYRRPLPRTGSDVDVLIERLTPEQKAELGRKLFGSWEGPETTEELIAIMEGNRHSYYEPVSLD